MGSALPSNAIVFLLDDRNGFWFDDIAKNLRTFGWQCGNDERFDQSSLEQSSDVSTIIEIFIKKITERLKDNPTTEFAVVTDSEFGDSGKGGAQLLNALAQSDKLKNRFRYGVVYSSNPQGNIIPGQIELLRQRASQLDADAQTIAQFFQSGQMGIVRQLIELTERLAFFWWLKEPKVFDGLRSQCSHLFRPVVQYGKGDENATQKNYFCDPILKGLGHNAITPFSPTTLKWFEHQNFESFARPFDRTNSAEASLPDQVRTILCPSESLCAALSCSPRENKFKRGSFRLLWDAVMSGNSSETLKRDYYPHLKKEVSLTDLDSTWEGYIEVFEAFEKHTDPHSAFEALWHGAMVEIEVISNAAKIVRERGTV